MQNHQDPKCPFEDQIRAVPFGGEDQREAQETKEERQVEEEHRRERAAVRLRDRGRGCLPQQGTILKFLENIRLC